MIRCKPNASWFWVVGAGVSAAVSGAREATWTGLILALVEHLCSRQITDEVLSIVTRDPAKWQNTPVNFWQVVDAVEENLGGSESVKRLLRERLNAFECRDNTLLCRLDAFSWPIATTNFDNLLSMNSHRGGPLFAHNISSLEVTDWLQNVKRSVLHLHGHVSQADGLLFSKSDYARYCHLDGFRRTQNQIFAGRPVFVGCGRSLTDPNIRWALNDRAKREGPMHEEPVVLRLDSDDHDFKVPVMPLGYGDGYGDLAPFLDAVLAELHGQSGAAAADTRLSKPADTLAGEAWMHAYCSRIAEDFEALRLPDFRTGDRDVPIPLDDVYVALALDHRDSQERLEEARLAHYHGASIEELIARDPMPRYAQTQRAAGTVVMLDDMLRSDPVVVVLGDPGAGKTTLAHWLARQAALSRCERRSDIVVEALRIDAEAALSGPRRIGPAWLPIVVPMRQYAAESSTLDARSARRMLDYLASHLAFTLRQDGLAVEPVAIVPTLESLAERGQLLVVLDGLDEIPRIQQREAIVNEVQHFAKWLVGTAMGIHPHATHPRAANRLLITSRLAGYKHAPLSVEVPHYEVQPMRPASVRRLMHNLFLSVSRSTRQLDAESAAHMQDLEAGLLRALDAPDGQLGSLTATPVLASAIFALYVGNDGMLPSDRRQVYARIVDLFVVREAKRLGAKGDAIAATATQLRRMIQRLAFEAFRAPDNTLIPEKQLHECLSELIASSDRNEVDLLPEHGIGLLVPRAPAAYGFIHRTFQEYLCAEHLMQPGRPFQQIVHLAGFATWREPARLGFMIWAAQLQERLDLAALSSNIDVLTRESRISNSLRPVVLAIAAVSEAHDPPTELMSALAGALIASLAASRSVLCEPSRDLIAAATSLIQQQDGAIALEQALETAIGDAQTDAGRTAVSAELMCALRFYPHHLVRALIEHEPCDPEIYDWPITRALLRLLTPVSGMAQGGMTDAARQDLDQSYLARQLECLEPSEATEYFRRHPTQMEQLRSLPAWARLLSALLGGQRDYEHKTHHQRYQHLASFLQLDDSRRQESRAWIPAAWLSLIDKKAIQEDLAYALAVYLDTISVPSLRASQLTPWMNVATFILKSEQWRHIAPRLADDAEVASECDPVLMAAVQPRRISLSGDNKLRARKVQRRLEDAARRGVLCITEGVAARAIEALASDEHQSMFIDSLCAAAAGFGITDLIGKFPLASLGVHASRLVRREQGAGAFHMFADDRVYTAAAWANTRAKEDYTLLVEIARARLLWAANESYLPRLPFPYLSSDFRHQVVDFLSIIDQCPKMVGAMLANNLNHLRRADPELFQEILSEARAVICRIEERQYNGNLPFDEMESVEDCRARLLAEIPTPWALRGRIRLLCVLDEGSRLLEEQALFTAAQNLPDDLLKAQTLELLARYAAHLPIDDTLQAGLAIRDLPAADAAAYRVRLLTLAARDLRPRIFAQALDLTQCVDGQDRVSLLRGLAAHAEWAGLPRFDLASHITDVPDAVTAAYIEGRYGDVLALLIDGPLREHTYFRSEAFAPLLVHLKLGYAVADGMPKETSSSGVERLISAQHALRSGDQTDILDQMARLSVNSPPGLLALWQRSRDHVRDPKRWEQMLAVLSVADRGLSPGDVNNIVDALSADHDGLRSRARALVLPQDHSLAAKTPSAAAQGLPLLLEVGRQIAWAETRRNVRVQLNWRLNKVELDDLSIAQRLVDAADAGADSALAVLDALAYITPQVTDYLARRFTSARNHTQQEVLGLFSRNQFVRAKKDAVIGPGLPALQASISADDSAARRVLIVAPDALVRALIAQPGEPREALQALRDASGTLLTEVFLRDHNSEAVWAIGRAAYAKRASEEERSEEYLAAVEALLASANGLRRIADVTFDLLKDSMSDARLEWLRGDLLVTLAAAAERRPAIVSSALQILDRRQLLAEASGHLNSFTGRRAAFLLMGCAFAAPSVEPLPDEIDALTRAAIDVPEVIDAALLASRRVRRLGAPSLNRLRIALYGDDSARAALAGRILISITNSSDVGQTTRENITDWLNQFVESPRAGRRAYFGRLDVFSSPAMSIRELLLNEFESGGEGVGVTKA
jgi:hypothetical protein